MWLSSRDDRRKSEHSTSELLERIRGLEHDQEERRSRFEADRQPRTLAAQFVGAAHVAPIFGGALEKFAQAMRAPLPRGRASGLARARSAWRC